MIDWLKVELPLHHAGVNGGQLISIDPEGNTDWEIDKRVKVRGSFESNIIIKSIYETREAREQGEAQALMIDGNPSKYLQGHNVDGIEDIIKLVLLTYEEICEYFKDLYSDLTYQKIKQGEFQVYRIDINHMYDLKTDNNVEQWLHAAELRAHGRSGRAQSTKGTVYLQKGSSLWSVSMYNKYREITRGGKKHTLIENEFFDKNKIVEYAKGKLRVEVRALAKQLIKFNLTKAKKLNNKIDWIFNELIGRCDMNANVELTNETENKLPNQVLGTYMLWKEGRSVKDIIPKATYYRHKKILKQFNIDITVQQVLINQSNVIPLLRVLEAKPVQRPEWLEEYIIQQS